MALPWTQQKKVFALARGILDKLQLTDKYLLHPHCLGLGLVLSQCVEVAFSGVPKGGLHHQNGGMTTVIFVYFRPRRSNVPAWLWERESFDPYSLEGKAQTWLPSL